MAAQSPPYALQNGQHSAALFRQATFSAWRNQSGTVGPNDLVVAAQSTPNMSVQVSAGRAWMLGSQIAVVSGGNWSPQAGYFGINDAPVSLSVAAADPTNPRIDSVGAWVQDAFYSGSSNQLVIGIVTGTPAATPVAPMLPNNAVALATYAVAANATSIVSGNISNFLGNMLVTRGGILPVRSNDTTAGEFTGQVRDLPTHTGTAAGGLQRWSGTAWQAATPIDFPLGQARQTTAQTGLSANTWTTITCTTADLDTHSGFGGGSYTVPAGQGGTYRLGGSVYAASGFTGYINARLTKNGSPITGSAGAGNTPSSSAGQAAQTVPVLVTLAAGDTISLQGYAASTFGTAVYSDGASILTIQRVL